MAHAQERLASATKCSRARARCGTSAAHVNLQLRFQYTSESKADLCGAFASAQTFEAATDACFSVCVHNTWICCLNPSNPRVPERVFFPPPEMHRHRESSLRPALKHEACYAWHCRYSHLCSASKSAACCSTVKTAVNLPSAARAESGTAWCKNAQNVTLSQRAEIIRNRVIGV